MATSDAHSPDDLHQVAQQKDDAAAERAQAARERGIPARIVNQNVQHFQNWIGNAAPVNPNSSSAQPALVSTNPNANLYFDVLTDWMKYRRTQSTSTPQPGERHDFPPNLNTLVKEKIENFQARDEIRAKFLYEDATKWKNNQKCVNNR